METSGVVQKLLSLTAFGGEWVLWLLIALSVVSIAVMIERALFFRRTGLKDFTGFCNNLLALLDAGKVEDAMSLCKQDQSFEGRIALTALKHAGKGPEAIERVTSGYITRERQVLDRGLMALGTLGNNTPFIGLFGTVLGIIEAFHDLALNPAGGSSVVMSGISEALVTTAVGLIVAIPAVVAFNAFQRVVKTRMANAEAVQQLVLSHFVRVDGPTRKSA
jgi:biopolymer transport protein ExbB